MMYQEAQLVVAQHLQQLLQQVAVAVVATHLNQETLVVLVVVVVVLLVAYLLTLLVVLLHLQDKVMLVELVAQTEQHKLTVVAVAVLELSVLTP
jgi:hypothetical protein